MEQSERRKLLILGQDEAFVEEVIAIIGARYSARCVPLESYGDLRNHFLHSLPPDGIIVQNDHSDYQKIADYLHKNELNVLLIAFSTTEFISKLDAYFSALIKWFAKVPYLPINSNLASFIGYTPVDLYIKVGSDFKLAIAQKSFISEKRSSTIFAKENGFFYIKLEDRPAYEEGWEESTLAYFKSNSSIKVTENGPMGILIPFLESTAYHGIPESDRYLLFSALERISYLLEENKELSEMIVKILQKTNYQLKHTSFLMCMNIAAMSALDIGSTVVLFNITFAALVHDLGTLNYGFEEYEFNDFAMEKVIDEELISKYSRHGEASLSLLVKNIECPSWVAEMVLSHHENDSGYGYPLGIHSSSLGLATFVFAFNHEWSEKIYGFMAKEKSKIDQNFFVEAIPNGSEQAKDLKSKMLKYLKFNPQ